MPITRIVSGGQTGADRGGLDAAIWCKVPHGGWCPKGRRALDGAISAKYQLVETKSRNYEVRTEANVVDSDATVIFSYGDLEGGSMGTAEYARKHGRPWLHVDLGKMGRQQAVDTIVEWLKGKCPAQCVLNVAGSRESKSPGIRGVVKAWMIDVVSKANGTLFYPIAEDAPSDEDDDGVPAATPDVAVAAAELIRRIEQKAADGQPAVSLFHPKTVEEAARILLEALNPETKDRVWAAADREEFVAGSHFGMAMWARNAMIHGNKNVDDLYADFQRGCREGKWSGAAEPDSVSGVIVGLVWDALHGGTR